MYAPRTYRRYTQSEDLISFKADLLETDLFISADTDFSNEAKACLIGLRRDLDGYIAKHPEFKHALEPVDVEKGSPFIVRDMADSAKSAGVGPMAAVAGAIAEAVGRQLMKVSSQVIIENGGDIFVSSKKKRVVGIYAGKSKLSEKVAIEILAEETPCGICTSSGTVGHSLSFGRADAVVVVSESASLADAAATAICNRVQTKGDIKEAISCGRKIKDVKGILIIIGDAFGAWGRIKLIDI